MRNVVLLCLDSVRKDVFDANASRIRAAADVSVEQCRAASSWSVPSHASVLTGTLPHQHGIHAHDRSYSALSRADTFLDDLPSHRAIGVSANVFASEDFGFDAPFDEFQTVSNVCRFPDGADPGRTLDEYDGTGLPLRAFLEASASSGRPLRSAANGFLAFLDAVLDGTRLPNVLDNGGAAVARACRSRVRAADEPFFLFANLMDAHTPLANFRGLDAASHSVPNRYTTKSLGVWDLMEAVDEHPAYVARWRDLYAATVDYLDRLVAGLVEWLRSNTSLGTTVVVTADHGENLGFESEGGLVRHKSSLSEGLLHVPLSIIDAPAAADASPGRYRYLSHLELGRLLAGLGAGEVPDCTADRVAAELVGMSAGPEPPSDRRYWDRMQRCVYDGDRKFTWDSLGNRQRSDLDPTRASWERPAGAVKAPPDWAAEFFDVDIERYKKGATADGSAQRVDAGTRQRLESLGYR